MMHGFGWAKYPITKRLHNLHPDIPITMLYGSRSWVDNITGDTIKNERTKSYVNVQVKHNHCLTTALSDFTCFQYYFQVINGAGHHVYLDKPDVFNRYVQEACLYSDKDGLALVKYDENESDQECDRIKKNPKMITSS